MNEIQYRDKMKDKTQPMEINIKMLIRFIIIQFQIHCSKRCFILTTDEINIILRVIGFCPTGTQSSLIMYNINE